MQAILARDKLSSLLQKSVNYGQKRLITLASGDHFVKLYFVGTVADELAPLPTSRHRHRRGKKSQLCEMCWPIEANYYYH
jgi:hypothetical protein